MAKEAIGNRSSALQLWAIGAIAPLLTIGWNMLSGKLASDWYTLWAGGRLAADGQAGILYDAAKSGIFFPYPPHALFFFMPFGPLSHAASYIAWNLLTAAFFLWAARPYLPGGFPRLLAVLTPGALMCMHFGQTGLLLGGLWLLAFRGSWASVALLTFKPHVGVLSALSLRSWPAVAKTAALVLALVVVSAVLFGPAAWRDFAANLVSHGSKVASFKRWQFAGVSPAMAYGLIGWLPFALAAGLLLMRRVNAFTAATAALLVSPYGFSYDMPLVSLGIGLAIWRHWHELGWGRRLGLALGFFVPTLASLGVWWMPPILLWVLWVQVNLPKEQAVTE